MNRITSSAFINKYFFFFLLLISGAIHQFLILSADFYYYNLSGREHCNTGIAPCLIGFFGWGAISLLGWLVGFSMILYYLLKNKLKRKWFIFLLGFFTYEILSWLTFETDWGAVAQMIKLPLLYLFSFGIQYIIFNKLLK